MPANQITARNLQVLPTITIRPGFRIVLLVHRDLVLNPWRDAMRHASVIAKLRAQIAELEGVGARRDALPFGVAAMDRHLPAGGPISGALHEIAGSPIWPTTPVPRSSGWHPGASRWTGRVVPALAAHAIIEAPSTVRRLFLNTLVRTTRLATSVSSWSVMNITPLAEPGFSRTSTSPASSTLRPSLTDFNAAQVITRRVFNSSRRKASGWARSDRPDTR
jgi:hypothetical protein